MTYATPQALRQALAARARQASRETAASASELVAQFYLGRLLVRDLCGTSATTTLDEAIATLVRAARLDLDDYLRFAVHSRDDRAEGNGTSRVRFTVSLGGRQISTPVSVDVARSAEPYSNSRPRSPSQARIGRPAIAPVRRRLPDWRTTARSNKPPRSRTGSWTLYLDPATHRSGGTLTRCAGTSERGTSHIAVAVGLGGRRFGS